MTCRIGVIRNISKRPKMAPRDGLGTPHRAAFVMMRGNCVDSQLHLATTERGAHVARGRGCTLFPNLNMVRSKGGRGRISC